MMKRAAIILISLSIALLIASCAEPSARERMMQRYDEIVMTDAHGKLPAEVVKTIAHYNEGNYWEAAIGFYEILQTPQYRALHESSQYYFTECLYRLELYQACSYELTNILFKGPDGSAYFTSALIKLLAITYETHDEKVIFSVLSSENMPIEKFPRQFRNELIYLLGKMNFEYKNYEEAYTKFSQVDPKSAFYAKANYFKGIIEVKREQYEKAKETFDLIQRLPNVAVSFGESKKVKEMSKLAVGQLFYAAAHKAPKENQYEIFKAAIAFYDQVDRDNPQWFESLFEKTWAATMIGRYGISLGTSLTLSSPFFDDRFVPEIHLIEAITWFTLCKYEQARSTLTRFFEDYTMMQERVKNYLTRDVPQMKAEGLEGIYADLLNQYEDAYKGRRTVLPIQVLTHVLNDNKFISYFEHIELLKEENARLDAAPSGFKNKVFFETTKKRLDRQTSNLMKVAAGWALKELQSVEGMLSQLLANAHNIDFELTDAERKRLEEAERYGLSFQSRVYEQEELLLSPAVPDSYQYWPFDGEYWKDELGYYLMAVEQECQ